MTETHTETPTEGIDPLGNAGLALMALRQMPGVPLDLLTRVESGLTEAQRRIAAQAEREANADAEKAVVQQRLDLALADVTRLRGDAGRMRDFKRRVRDAAIKAHKDENWCLEGLNSALSDLGLDTYSPVRKFTVEVKEKGHRTASIEVEVDGSDGMSDSQYEEAARQKAYEEWSNDRIPSHSWDEWESDEASDTDEWDITAEDDD